MPVAQAASRASAAANAASPRCRILRSEGWGVGFILHLLRAARQRESSLLNFRVPQVSTGGGVRRWPARAGVRLVATAGEQCHRELGQGVRGQHAHALTLPHRQQLHAVEDITERLARALLARQLDEGLAPYG